MCFVFAEPSTNRSVSPPNNKRPTIHGMRTKEMTTENTNEWFQIIRRIDGIPIADFKRPYKWQRIFYSLVWDTIPMFLSFILSLSLSPNFFFFSALVTPLYTLHASFRYINRYFEEISSSQFIDFPCVIRFISLFATAICPYIESEADAGGKETSVCNPIRYLQKSSNQTCYFELFKRYIMALYSSMSTFTRLLLPCSFSGTREFVFGALQNIFFVIYLWINAFMEHTQHFTVYYIGAMS